MARLTQQQKIRQENEQQALHFFQTALAALPDPRRRQGVRYPFETVLIVALMGMVCGCDDAEALGAWGDANADWLMSFLEMPHGPPTQDVFLAVFGSLEPEAFSSVFRSWANLLLLRLGKSGKHIAVDGKTSRRSFDQVKGQTAIHTVSAWLSDFGLVLGQRKTGEKSNEITAIPELLKTLDLRGVTVTIDAMGCQTAIAQTIVDGGGNYFLAVKDNQPKLHEDIIKVFSEADNERQRSLDELDRPAISTFEEIDKGHGRLEKRTVALCHDLNWLTTGENWPGLATVVQVIRECTDLSSNTTSSKAAYYIGSNPESTASEAAHTIRRHWGIETELHWVLDMAFREDEARHRAAHTAQNMTTLRHFALNIIKQDKTRKVGISNSRKRAGWDRGYLLKLLTGHNPTHESA
jgi:predicted transposase YbfD/YdcC